MRFLVDRVSGYDGAPCPEAYRATYTRVNRTKAHSPLRADWDRRGIAYRIDGDEVSREVHDEGWFVDITSLDDLMAFYRRHGRLILDTDMFNEDIPKITIYDDYNE